MKYLLFCFLSVVVNSYYIFPTFLNGVKYTRMLSHNSIPDISVSNTFNANYSGNSTYPTKDEIERFINYMKAYENQDDDIWDSGEIEWEV